MKEWLDKLVDNNLQQYELITFNNQIRTFTPSNCILISTGIELIAEAMGIELTEELDEDKEFSYTYYFYYRGICFMQLEKERLVIDDVQV